MDLLRSRTAAIVTAFALATAFSACGDNDGRGAAEEVEKGAKELEQGAKEGAKELEREGRELEQDARKQR